MHRNCLFALLTACALASAAQTNLVKNGSFEQVGENGMPVGWKLSQDVADQAENPELGKIWGSSTENAQDGERSLLYDNKTGVYRFVTQAIPAEPGKSYRYSVYAKIVPVTEEAKKASPAIFFEYSNNGKYVGGEYGCFVVNLNTDWVKVMGKATVPEGVNHVTVGFRVAPNATDAVKVWFDKCEVVEAVADVFGGGIASNRYREQSAGGMVTVYCGRGLGIAPFPEETFAASRLELVADGETVLTAPVSSVQKDKLVYVFDSDKVATGKYTMQVVVTAPDGTRHTQEAPFTKLAAPPNYKAYIDEHKRMMVDGKLFFPLGMFISSIDTEDLGKRLVGTPFNCIMPYVTPKSREQMDFLYRNNLRVFFSIKNFVSPKKHDAAATKTLHQQGMELLKAWKDHPAVIAWYINDELSEEFVDDAIQYQKLCEEMDPDHPTWTVLCRPNEFRSFMRASDIHGSDPYPIPDTPPAHAYREARQTYDAVMGAKMLIQVPQIFSWGFYYVRYGYPKERCVAARRPTFEEMDAMSWMSIAAGANGLIYYSYTDLLRREKDGELPKIPIEEHLSDCYKVGERIMSRKDVLLSIEKPAEYKVTANSENAVAFRPYALNGVTWILAVNTSHEKESSFVLELEHPMTLEGLELSDAKVTVSAKQVTGALKPLESVFIKLK